MLKEGFMRSEQLLGFYLRKDHIKLIFWSIALLICTVGIIAYFPELYSTEIEKEAIAATMKNPAMIAMAGSIYGNSPFTIGELAAQQMLFFTTILAVIMNIGIALKNTRSDEDDGTLEMITSFPVGRYSNIIATFLELILVNIVNAIFIGIGLYLLNIEGINLEGAMVFGFGMMMVGLVFGSATIIFAQLSSNLRSAQFLSYGFFGIMYIFRASTDIKNEKLSWLSPMAWANKTEVFVNNNIFPIILAIITSIFFILIAIYFNKIRDIGSGIIPNSLGKKNASNFLKTSFGFTFKQEQLSILIWLVSVAVIGASYGSVFGDLNSFMENDTIAKVVQSNGQNDLATEIIPLITMVMAIMISIPTINIINRLYREEKNSRIEQLYALPLSRKKLLLNHIIISCSLGIIGLLIGSLVTWLTASSVMKNPIPLKSFISASLAFTPAILILIGIATAMLGWLPRQLKLIWFYLTISFMIVYFGDILQLPEWTKSISPFGIIPRVPIEDFDYIKFIIMIIVSLVLMIIGFIGYRKRDITP